MNNPNEAEKSGAKMLADIQVWLKATGIDAAMALIDLVRRGEIGSSTAVDPEHGTVFLLAMAPANRLGSLAGMPTGIPGDTLIPMPVAQLLTGEQAQQVSQAGASGRMVLFDATAATRQPAANEPPAPFSSEQTQDWRYEVANGDTVLGLSEWCAHQRESRVADNAQPTNEQTKSGQP